MPMRDALLPEFDHEMANTRKTLERVPEDKFDWKPHAKSGTMGWLASHIADMAGWAAETITKDELDLSPDGKPYVPPPPPKSRADLLAKFDGNVKAAREALAKVSDEELGRIWALKMTGATLLSMPKAQCLRSFVFSHTIHHRAQLGVYLRLNDVPVPAMYGPSADEQGM